MQQFSLFNSKSNLPVCVYRATCSSYTFHHPLSDSEYLMLNVLCFLYSWYTCTYINSSLILYTVWWLFRLWILLFFELQCYFWITLQTNVRGCCEKDQGAMMSHCCGGSEDIPCPCTNTCEAKIMNYSDIACKITGGIGLFISFTEVMSQLHVLSVCSSLRINWAVLTAYKALPNSPTKYWFLAQHCEFAKNLSLCLIGMQKLPDNL